MKKVIKGTPMYNFKGDTYFERPKGTRCVKMKYDPAENVTFITLKKNHYFLEVLAIIVAILTAVSVFVVKPKLFNEVQYSTPIEWYNGNLNVNLIMSEDNKLPVEYDINGTTGILLAGEKLYSIPCEVQPDSVDINLKIGKYLFTFNHSETVPVYNLSAER